MEVYEGLDGHMYTVEKGRNGEEKVSREDSKIKEISIALRKLVCYYNLFIYLFKCYCYLAVSVM